MTVEDLKKLNLSLETDDLLYVEAGLEWLCDNTTLKVDLTNMDSIKAMPSTARLFLVKFCEICNRDIGVIGESVGPMSQNFTADSAAKQTAVLARQLLKPYLKPSVEFIPCIRRWR